MTDHGECAGCGRGLQETTGVAGAMVFVDLECPSAWCRLLQALGVRRGGRRA